MDSNRLVEILESHKKWLNDETGGMRAHLSGADLQDADLRGADLQGAYLRGAYLQDADLRGVKNLNIPFSCPSDGAFVGWKKM